MQAALVRTLLGCRGEVGDWHLESNRVLRMAARIAESIGAREEIERVRVGPGIERPQAGHFLGRERVAGIGHREIPIACLDAQSRARQLHFDFAKMPVVALWKVIPVMRAATLQACQPGLQDHARNRTQRPRFDQPPALLSLPCQAPKC